MSAGDPPNKGGIPKDSNWNIPGAGTDTGGFESAPGVPSPATNLEEVEIGFTRPNTEKSSMDGYFNPAYDVSKPNPYSPSTDKRCAIAMIGIVAIPVALEVFGTQALVDFMIEEAK
jgi:hypothetical protein